MQQKSAVKDLHIGVSAKYGERDANKVNYDMAGISTAGRSGT